MSGPVLAAGTHALTSHTQSLPCDLRLAEGQTPTPGLCRVGGRQGWGRGDASQSSHATGLRQKWLGG